MPKSVLFALLILFGFAVSLLPSSAQEPSKLASAATSVTKLPVGPAISERVCVLPTPGYLQCTALRLKQRPPGMAPASGAADPNSAPSGFGPADLLSAYNLNSASALNGAGVTIAIVDAQDDPNAESDLGVYRSTFGLPPCTTANGCFRKVNGSGQTSPLPTPDTGWAGEIALDIDMVSAICPNCNILLVEATSATDANLDQAEDTAFSLGAKAISNSYGGSETSSDPSECLNHYNHPGIAITASSGDEGYEVEFPAACGLVTAVGGTSLERTSNNARGWEEVVWSTSSDEGTGSGCSNYETKPAWQTDTGCSKRTVADVSAVADPDTGVAVYDTYGDSGWAVYGGTSVAAPLIAGVYGLAEPALDSDVPAMYAYANANAFYDVTAGKTSNCGTYLCTAEVGYDGPTGLGTPNGVGGFEPATQDDFSIADNPNSLTIAQGTSGSSRISSVVTSGSAETVTLSVRGLPSGATASFSPASISSGQSATLNINAGTAAPTTYSLTIVGTALSGAQGAGLSLNVAAPATLTSPTSGSTLGTSNVQFTWTAGTDVTEYQLWLGLSGPGSSSLYTSGWLTAPTTSTTVPSLPEKGATIFARLYSMIGGKVQYIDYTYVETGTPAAMSTPAQGSTLGTSNVQFAWTAGTGVTEYQLWLGLSGPGSSSLYTSGWLTAPTTSTTVTSLPERGATVYARLYSMIGGKAVYNDYTYVETGAPATMTTPAQGSTLGTSNVQFTWTAGTGVTEYNLWLGLSGPGSSSLYTSGWLTAPTTSTTVPSLPAHGATVYARLYSMIGGKAAYNDYTYVEQ